MATGGRITHSKNDGSDEIVVYACSPCSKRNNTNEGLKFCVECQEFLCPICVDNHNSFSALTGHSLLDKSQFGSIDGSNAGNVTQLPTERCKLHLTKSCSDIHTYICTGIKAIQSGIQFTKTSY